jgi:L-asparaginase
VSRVAVVFTGGTISMRPDPAAGGNVPTLRGEEILELTPGLDDIADVVAIDRGLTPASHFGWPDLFAIGADVRAALADPAIDGAVVVQGTDTIEETAFFWDLTLDGPKPLVVTGAMRTSLDPDFDGPRNLRDAVRVAAAPAMADQGVMVVLSGTIEPADDVTKTHASALDTFRSLNLGSLGGVDDAGVVLNRARGSRRHVMAERAAERAYLVTAHVAMDGSLVDAVVEAGADGLVVEATGAGNTSLTLLEAAERAMGRGVPVGFTTRCPAGRATDAYAFPGGGATWYRAGALPAGFLGGPKARVALAVGLGAGLRGDDLAALLAGPEGSA